MSLAVWEALMLQMTAQSSLVDQGKRMVQQWQYKAEE